MHGVDLILSSLGSNTLAFTRLSNDIFLSTTIKIIFLLYDQPSKDLATTFLTTSTYSHHEWLTVNVDSIFPKSKSHYKPTVTDQNLIIAVFNDWELWKIKYYDHMINNQGHANFMFVSNDENLETDMIYQRLESLHQKDLLYYSAVFLHLTNSMVNCYTLKHHFDNKHELILIEISNNRSIFDQLFWNRYKQMDKGSFNVTAIMRFPYLFVGKRRSKVMPEQYDYGMSGSFIYMAGIMADYLNATMDLFLLSIGIHKYNRKTYQFDFTNVENAYLISDRDPLVPASVLQE